MNIKNQRQDPKKKNTNTSPSINPEIRKKSLDKAKENLEKEDRKGLTINLRL